jgi:hypothetical protein
VFSRLDSLFIAAATGEPRFQALRDSSEKALLADTGLLDYLVKNRLTRQMPRQQQYVERLFTLRSDSGRNAGPRDALARVLVSPVSDTMRALVLYVGSRIGDTAFRSAALPWLSSSFEPSRRMAVRSLGAYPRPENLRLLWDDLRETSGLERHQCLWALEAQGPLRDWKALVPLLEDFHVFNRRKVRDMLLKATDSSWAVLRSGMPAAPADAARREWRLLAGDAKGGKEFLEGEKAAMTREEREFFNLAR